MASQLRTQSNAMMSDLHRAMSVGAIHDSTPHSRGFHNCLRTGFVASRAGHGLHKQFMPVETPGRRCSLKANLCNLSAFSSMTSPCLTSLPLTRIVNGVTPLWLTPPAAETTALSDRIIAEVLPQLPDGPLLDQNVTPYRP
jgi:hypothetical protein